MGDERNDTLLLGRLWLLLQLLEDEEDEDEALGDGDEDMGSSSGRVMR